MVFHFGSSHSVISIFLYFKKVTGRGSMKVSNNNTSCKGFLSPFLAGPNCSASSSFLLSQNPGKLHPYQRSLLTIPGQGEVEKVGVGQIR